MRHLSLEQIFDLPQLSIISAGILLPPSPGLYFVLTYSPTQQIVYIGKAKNLQQRWRNHHRMKDLLLLEAVGVKLSLAFTPGIVSYSDSLLYADESFLIQEFNPLLNGWSTPIGFGPSNLSDNAEEVERVDCQHPQKEQDEIQCVDPTKLIEISAKHGWISASKAKQFCRDLRPYSPAQIRGLFQQLSSGGQGYLRGDGDGLEWRADQPCDPTKLIEISRKHGWVTASKAKASIWAFKQLSVNEIRDLFEEYHSSGLGFLRGDGDSLEWCYQESNLLESDFWLEDKSDIVLP